MDHYNELWIDYKKEDAMTIKTIKTWADDIENKYEKEIVPLLDEMLERQKEQILVLSCYQRALKDLLKEKKQKP